MVDEVQDLSPLQLRMLARRSLSGSMTVVGDIAQATAPWAPRTWSEITEHLPHRRDPRTVELTVSYRTPAEVIEVAARVLAVAAPELRRPRPVRRTGVAPRMVSVEGPDGPTGAPSGVLADRVAAEAVAEVAAVAPGRVAVLAPEPMLPALADALDRGRVPRWPTPGGCAGAACRSRWCCWPPTPPTAWSSTPWWWWSRRSSPGRRPAGCGRSTSP